MAGQRRVFQFKITLETLSRPIWRRIQISDVCTYWDLHEAIQAAMGWEHCHLHLFEVKPPGSKEKVLFGMPHYEMDVNAGWDHRVSELVRRKGKKFLYEYDFGDSWCHEVVYEGSFEKELDRTYPVCIEGERACPPEDVGGFIGFERFLEAIADPEHEEHEERLAWHDEAYDPETFDPRKVKFKELAKPMDWG